MLVHGVTHSAPDLSARLLAQLKGNAETALGGRSVLSAVVGVRVRVRVRVKVRVRVRVRFRVS